MRAAFVCAACMLLFIFILTPLMAQLAGRQRA